MNESEDANQQDLLRHVVVPVVDEDDARKTAAALERYDPNRVTALHVVEKGMGVPDKTPVEFSEEQAETAYAAIRDVFPEADEHTAYARDVVAAIFEAADQVDASAIVYRSRGGNRLLQFLSGDRSLGLVTRAERPVIALPQVDEEA